MTAPQSGDSKDEAVQSIALLHDAHHRNASRLEKLIDAASALVSRPACLVVIGLGVALWVATNVFARQLGFAPFDPPPFDWANDILTLLALVVAILIVTAQNRSGRLGERREQMTLELTLLTEQKTAKIIALIEELRRDSPGLHNRFDHEAHAMSAPADPHAVLGKIEETATVIQKKPDAKTEPKETAHDQ